MTIDPGEASSVQVRSVSAGKQSAVDLVAAELRRSIVSGALAPGEPFGVSELAEKLGVSHIPVREALRRLEAQGMVVLSPARSAVVAPLDLADFEAIYRLRVQIEPPLAARSTALQTKASFRQLHGLLSASLQTDHEPDAQWHSHTAFHLSLVEPAASPWDLRFLEQLWDAAERYQRFAFQWREIGDEERERRAHVHLKLLDACLAGDSVAVERSVHEHLVENGDAIRAFLTDI